MTTDIALFLGILFATIILFSWEVLPIDVVAIGVVLALILTGALPMEDAFAGFGSETVVMLFGLLVLTEALVRNGVVDYVGSLILRWIGKRPDYLISAVALFSGLTSSVMSNTAATAFYLPIALGLARRTQTNPAKVLMPLAFASILASSLTLVATSTNIVVSGLMRQNGLAPLGMFELTPVGLPIFGVGLLYLLTVGQRLIPVRAAAGDEQPSLDLLYTAEVQVPAGSNWVGRNLESTAFAQGLSVLQLIREGGQEVVPWRRTLVRAQDELVVEGRREDILSLKPLSDIVLHGELEAASTGGTDAAQIVEVMLMPGSPLIGRTLRNFNLSSRYNMQILALNRHGKIARSKVRRQRLAVGDVLVVQISKENLELLKNDNYFRILDIFQYTEPNPRQGQMAALLFGAAILLAATNLMSIGVAVLLATFLAFALRCITPEEAYLKLEWRLLIVIGSMLALGTAMQATGTADYLAMHLVQVAGEIPPVALLSLFFMLAVLLTQPMSNQAAAAVLVPVAIQTAAQLNLNPRPFVVMIAVAASCSFLTPLEPACMMVYGIGRYRFMDFVRVGSPLTLAIYLIAVLLVPLFWAF